MKISTNILKMFFIASLLGLSSCETFDLDQTENPSTLPTSFLDPVYSFNYVQLQLPEFVDQANSFTQRVTRQMAMTGGRTYDNAFSPELFDRNWTTGYLILNAVKQMEPKAVENKQNYILGASKVIRCYVLMTLVDLYGDIPYSQALMGNDNLNPAYDNSASVYAGIYQELNAAIGILQLPSENVDEVQDLYYGDEEASGGSPAPWITLANTLKLKMLYTARLTGIPGFDTAGEVNAIIAGDDIIDNIDKPNEDFIFKYGVERELPNSRHPDYNNDYEFGGGPYLGNYFLWAVSREKREPVPGPYPYFDPRTDYYFYSQTVAADGDSQTLPCETIARPEHYLDDEFYSFYLPNSNPTTAIAAAYCTTNLTGDATAYWGRDHGDASGIPADEFRRTVHGLYPAGGKISPRTVATQVTDSEGTEGALGEGLMPIVMSSFVHFMKAELALMQTGVSGDPLASLETGIRQSIDKVTSFFPTQPGEPSQAITDSKTEAYVTFVRAAYNNPDATLQDKLQVIVKEFYVAAWGNGIEPYNNYRRTGYPSNMQPTLEPSPGQFFYTALYPAVAANNNPNAPANVRTRKVFWEETAGLTLH